MPGGDPQGLNGAELGFAWALPFAGLLVSIALLPLLAPRFWEHHFAKIALFWALCFVVPCGIVFGTATAATETLRTLLVEYLPFILLVFSLFVVAGGIRVVGNLVGTPATNTALLAFGTIIASFLGTTGAAMVLIRPVIRANQDRRYKTHIFVFFIFLVCNIGGSLTPLGDPPLFIGFLKGVDFLWTVKAMIKPMLLASGLLLILFFAIEQVAWRYEPEDIKVDSGVPRQVRIEGVQNVLYLMGVVAAVLFSGLWEQGVMIPVGLGIQMPLNGLARDAVLLGISYLSWKTTRPATRIENAFAWTPIQEVAVLFAAIFVVMIPALAMLRVGLDGPFAPLLRLVSTPDGQPVNAAYFWLTGALSSVLDNAPTYLVFFNLAGGDPEQLMGPLAGTLLAISAGAVFMGANTYIGNAPNFMVRSICEERGVRMPSFFGYLLWSTGILIPLFILLTIVIIA